MLVMVGHTHIQADIRNIIYNEGKRKSNNTPINYYIKEEKKVKVYKYEEVSN